ncbi:MAG: type II toxin-antitoxin system VapC family toxin [Candidatus Rokuibacteriota bacterium]
MNYLDTSALIKRFVLERGSQMVAAMVEREGPIATATIAYAEVHAGLARKRREHDLSSVDYDTKREQFEGDWGTYVRLDLGQEILQMTRDLVARHPLRAADAIHLASALTLRTALGQTVRFVAADDRLLRAAEAERLPTLDVERGPGPTTA